MEDLQREQGTPEWLFASMAAKFDYPQGFELTPAAYAEALEATANERIG
jgi:hypothetical protein